MSVRWVLPGAHGLSVSNATNPRELANETLQNIINSSKNLTYLREAAARARRGERTSIELLIEMDGMDIGKHETLEKAQLALHKLYLSCDAKLFEETFAKWFEAVYSHELSKALDAYVSEEVAP